MMHWNSQKFLKWIDRIVAWAQKVVHSFSRLQWRLALLYTLVTTTGFTLLLGVLVFFTSNTYYNSSTVGMLLPAALAEATTQLAPGLNSDPIQQTILDEWISRALSGNNLFISGPLSEENPDIGISFTTIASPDTLIIIIDRHGVVRASNHPDLAPIGAPVPLTLPETGLTLIKRAQNDEQNPLRLFSSEKTRLLSAAGIRLDPEAPLVGTVYIQAHQPNAMEMAGYSLVATLSNAVLLTIIGGVIGMVFGLLVARGLDKRLKAVSEAAAAWGQGNFSRRIKDRSKDEIGMLARDMNNVAGQLETLMNTRQELAAFEERNRLARDLHDSVKQQVFATTMNLGAAQALWEQNPIEAHKRLEIAANLSKQSQQELSLLIQTLRPLQIDEKNLAEALRDHLSMWERNSNISVQAQIPSTLPPLPYALREVIYRVCQEALSNIARHSEATVIQVSLTTTPEQLQLQIKDNGKGFDPQKNYAGLGLRSMHERVQSQGGNIFIESSIAGTRLRIFIPIHKEG